MYKKIKLLTWFSSFSLCGVINLAHAGLITIKADIDYQITTILEDGLFDDFLLHEKVDVYFTLDDNTLDSYAGLNRGEYIDPVGFYRIVGTDSGASVSTNNGIFFRAEYMTTPMKLS